MGCKEYHATLKQSVPKEQVFFEAKCESARYVFRNKSLDSAFLLVVLGIYQLNTKTVHQSSLLIESLKNLYQSGLAKVSCFHSLKLTLSYKPPSALRRVGLQYTDHVTN